MTLLLHKTALVNFPMATTVQNTDFGQGAAKISEVKVGGRKNLPDQPDPGCIEFKMGRVGNFLPTSNFDLEYLCSLFTYKSGQYLI